MTEIVRTKAISRSAAIFGITVVVVTVALAVGWSYAAGLLVPLQDTPPWLVASPIAHRGLHTGDDRRPENSMAAFRAAVDDGYPVELDVHLSADGIPVVFHDANLERLTGDTRDIGEVTAEELSRLALLGTDETVPSLGDVFGLIEGRVPVLIEIKQRGEAGALEQAVIDVLAGYRGEVAVQSFNPYSLRYLRNHAPNLPRGQLSGSFTGEDLPTWQVFALRNLLMNWASQPAFIAYELEALPSAATTLQQARGRPLIAWTVSDPTGYEAAQLRADGIIFDPGAF